MASFTTAQRTIISWVVVNRYILGDIDNATFHKLIDAFSKCFEDDDSSFDRLEFFNFMMKSSERVFNRC